MNFWQTVGNNINENWKVYSSAIIWFAVAVGTSMPEKFPSTVQEVWDWLRNSIQTSLPAARRTISPSGAQSPPVTLSTVPPSVEVAAVPAALKPVETPPNITVGLTPPVTGTMPQVVQRSQNE
jgi:hypothetical protein